jgi:CrcB protein
LLVNVVGSLLLGALMHAAHTAKVLPEGWLLFAGTGIMGGFTTYSTFNWETLQLAQRGAYGQALLYVGTTLVVCLAAGALGAFVAKAAL